MSQAKMGEGFMLDDANILRQRDPSGALTVAAEQYTQALFAAHVTHSEHDHRELKNIVFTGMGGSALAALIAKTWLSDELQLPFEVVRDYTLPAYVNENTLVISASYSGNTEETLSCFKEARERGAQLGVIASGGELLGRAEEGDVAYVAVPSGLQPRMATIYQLRALLSLLSNFNVVTMNAFGEIAAISGRLEQVTRQWTPDVSTDKNEAKQLALRAVGKTPVIYASRQMAPLAYKWKISFNETSKNVAFNGELPEFNHNEFMGWTSHPIEKPFAVFDLMSSFDSDRVKQRFALSDKLLSGRRPKAHPVQLEGETLLEQMLKGCILADFVSIYAAILNNVDPTPVELIEKLKKELAQ